MSLLKGYFFLSNMGGFKYEMAEYDGAADLFPQAKRRHRLKNETET